MTAAPAYTDQQRLAIQTRDVSVALDAGAGCGKTFVLTERFLSHLDPEDPGAPPAEIDELIAITFTDAAARELRNRIRTKCQQRLATASEEHADYWRRMVRRLDSARVDTIHGFCSKLIRAHAIDLGHDPSFRVMDQAAAQVMQSVAMDDFLRERVNSGDQEAISLAARLGFSGLKSRIGEFVAKRHDPAFARWRNANASEVLDSWRAQSLVDMREAAQEVAASPEAQRIVELLSGISPEKPKFQDARAALLDRLPTVGQSQDPQAELAELRELAKVQGVCTKKDWPSPEEFADYKAACEAFRKSVDGVPALADEEELLDAAESGLAILRLADGVAQQYEAAKRDAGGLDFDDLLKEARRLVTDDAFRDIRKRLCDGVRLLLVDEFQDTDSQQVEIVTQLVDGAPEAGRLFFVGDYKQSIYRFRNAEPQVFRDLAGRIPQQGRLPLSQNFRSQPAILDFVNALFRDVFGADYAPLVPARRQATDGPAIEFLWTLNEKNEEGKSVGATDHRRSEARAIARRLRELIDSKAEISTEPSGERRGAPKPVELRDIAILFRKLSDVQVYEQALQAEGLDYYLVGGHAFYWQQEVFDLLNLLRSVTSSCDEISLAGALRSPFFALHDETLFWLAHAGHGSLSRGLFSGATAKGLSKEESEKVHRAAAVLQELRTERAQFSAAQVIELAIRRTGYDAVLLAEFLGERKLANLRKLMEQARNVEGGDLISFIRQLAEFTERPPKEALAATMSETADVIRLMTVHYAKGLEFPVVVVPDIGGKPRNNSSVAALSAQLGPLVKVGDTGKKAAVGIDFHKSVEKREDAAERERLFYVACTRAADYLMLSASMDEEPVLKNGWGELLAQRFDIESGAFIAPLEPGYTIPNVTVTWGDARAPSESRTTQRADLQKLIEKAKSLAKQGRGVLPALAAPAPFRSEAITRFSVSRLSGQLSYAQIPDADPSQAGLADSFTHEGDPAGHSGIDPRGFGTLVHAVLERIRPDTTDAIEPWCEKLAPLHVRKDWEGADAAAALQVRAFVASSRFAAIGEASQVARELEFLLPWPLGAGERRTAELQGYIDCLYKSADGGWRIVDYKTGHVTPDSARRKAEEYRFQLGVYALAIEATLSERPTELVVSFLRPGVEVAFDWDDAARAATIRQVDQAIVAVRTAASEAYNKRALQQ